MDDWCVFCWAPAQGNYSVHTTSTMQGPEVPLCDRCGSQEAPLLGQIWHAIAHRYHVVITPATKEVALLCAVCKGRCVLMNPTTRTRWWCVTCRRNIVIEHFEDMAFGMREVHTKIIYEARVYRPNAKWAF